MLIVNALQTSMNGGIGRVSYNAAKALYLNNENNVRVVIREKDLSAFDFVMQKDLIIAKGIKNSKDRNYYEQFTLPKYVKKNYEKPILFYPDSMGPIFSSVPFIIIVHDLAFKSLKQAFTWKSILWKRIATKISVKKSIHIVTDSDFSRSEILKYYKKIEANKITSVKLSFNDFSKEIIDKEKVRAGISSIGENFIFTVSTISPRKNIDRLIKSFNLIKDKVDVNLVISGREGWLSEDIYNLVDIYNIKDRVIFTGGINDEELKNLYDRCSIFIYPSIYEGFGLPPLEALSYGKTVIASKVTSIPEVLGKCAVYIDPFDTNDIAEKMIATLNNDVKLDEELIKSTLGKYSFEVYKENLVICIKKVVR